MTRIAYLLTQDSGGPVDVTVRLAGALAESGAAEVRVFGPRPRRGAGLVDPFFEETLVTRKGDMAAARQARAAIRAWRPDVVHAQDRRAGLVSAGLATTGTKIVHTYHGVPDDVAEPWFRNVRGATPPPAYTRAVLAADAAVARVVHRTVVPAREMGRFLRERLYVPPHRMTHIDNCVDVGIANPPTGPVRKLVFVGLLVERKGLLDLLDALETTMPRDATLTVVGDGPLRTQAEGRVTRRGLGDRVRFLGFRSDVPELLLKHDALVLPSTMEQQPLVVAEAMAAGKPVVATDTGGVADMLGVPGEECPRPGDVEALAARLRALFADPDPASTGALLAMRARERFTAEVCARRHLDLYGELIAGSAC
ncbi:glycosyltransferase family 4 protein [Lentzea jiangxiensis]|uniref:Glycosyltransferase involved in cell wall bisynthesis n=1 Tax=Lentzea jiangxiensis TaxID=641025 RepID=A0A1H0SGV7_9PSEU|nr:glycosyltransferase family 4 protein [Lentzea jiangxiensis]SDP41041.1 Glycosyltransferase involved in cell wall bisynthesis [Lentzea jiangxiensis]